MAHEDSDGPIETRRNLELKARCADLSAARAGALALGAKPARVEAQLDTYYVCRSGRLKLRQVAGRRAVLIWYRRPDEEGVRLSEYHLTPVTDAARLKSALEASLGVRGVVKKRRELLRWENVRIHLDSVEGLGCFVEFEAVLSEEEDEERSRERLARLIEAMGVADEEVIAGSYADLLGI